MNRTILLIEDNPSDISLTRRALEQSCIHNGLIVAEDGQEALDFFDAGRAGGGQQSATMPALILLDLKLPKVSGLDVLGRIKGDERTRHLPVVVLTTSSECRDVSSAYALGANSYIVKPVDFRRFRQTIAQICLYWLGWNQPRPTRLSAS